MREERMEENVQITPVWFAIVNPTQCTNLDENQSPLSTGCYQTEFTWTYLLNIMAYYYKYG